MSKRPVTRPLEDIKVVDLTHALSGPTCTNQLALLGAEVIKIERPGVGDDFRHYTEHAGLPGMSVPFAGTNNGKQSITVDLKSPAGIDIVRRLVAGSDVLVENFRPGVAAKLGLDYASLKAINPRLVYAAISGFGQTGPLRDWTAYDHIVQAMAGLMLLNGEPDGDPLKVGFPIVDLFTGYIAVIGILTALHRRHGKDEGDFVDVSMLESALDLVGAAVPTYFYTNQLTPRTGNRGYRLVATSETYKTLDGYIAIGANQQHQIEAMCDVLECTWLLQDPRFANHKARVSNYAALRAALVDIFAQLNGAQLEPQLAARSVPVALVRDLSQILQHPHLTEREVFLDSHMPGSAKPARIIGPGFQLGSGRLAAGPVPELGQHTDAVLEGLGFDAAAIAALRRDGVV